MKKQTITGQIYTVTANENCSYCEVRAKKNGVFYTILTLQPNEQGTFQAISDEVEIQGDDKAIILPFNAARATALGTGKKADNTDIDLSLSVMNETIGYLQSEQQGLKDKDAEHGEKISQIEKDLLTISSGSSLTPEQVEMVSIITNDDFLMFADNLDVSTFKDDLQKLYEGKLTSHLSDTSLHSGGGADLSEIAISARTFDGQRLSMPFPPLPDGSTWKEILCVIDMNLLAQELENKGYNFCDENGGASSGGTSEGYNRFVVFMAFLETNGPPFINMGDISDSYETVTVKGKTFTRKFHYSSNATETNIFNNAIGISMIFDGDGEVSLKEFTNAFHAQVNDIWCDEQHDLIHIIPSYRYEW